MIFLWPLMVHVNRSSLLIWGIDQGILLAVSLKWSNFCFKCFHWKERRVGGTGLAQGLNDSRWVWLSDWEASQSLVPQPVNHWGVVSLSLNAVLWGEEPDKSCNYLILLQQIARFLKSRQAGWGNISSNEYCDGCGRLALLPSGLLLGHCCWSAVTANLSRSWAHYCEV